MGKARINSHLGAGLYSVTYIKDVAQAKKELNNAQKTRTQLFTKLAKLSEGIPAAQEALLAAQSEFEDALYAWEVCALDPACKEGKQRLAAVTVAVEKVGRTGRALRDIELQIAATKLQQLSLLKKISKLNSQAVDREFDQREIWSVDFPDPADGAGEIPPNTLVGTAETYGARPLERPPTGASKSVIQGLEGYGGQNLYTPNPAVNVLPGYTSAAYSAPRDGKIVPIASQSDATGINNTLQFLKVYGSRPRYSYATLTAKNDVANTGTITLFGLNATGFKHPDFPFIAGSNTLEIQNVPFEYMSCNSLAFAVGDKVIVSYTGNNLAGAKIIGFASNPRPCSSSPGIMVTAINSSKYALTAIGGSWSASLSNKLYGKYGYWYEYSTKRATTWDTSLYLDGQFMTTFSTADNGRIAGACYISATNTFYVVHISYYNFDIYRWLRFDFWYSVSGNFFRVNNPIDVIYGNTFNSPFGPTRTPSVDYFFPRHLPFNQDGTMYVETDHFVISVPTPGAPMTITDKKPTNDKLKDMNPWPVGSADGFCTQSITNLGQNVFQYVRKSTAGPITLSTATNPYKTKYNGQLLQISASITRYWNRDTSFKTNSSFPFGYDYNSVEDTRAILSQSINAFGITLNWTRGVYATITGAESRNISYFAGNNMRVYLTAYVSDQTFSLAIVSIEVSFPRWIDDRQTQAEAGALSVIQTSSYAYNSDPRVPSNVTNNFFYTVKSYYKVVNGALNTTPINTTVTKENAGFYISGNDVEPDWFTPSIQNLPGPGGTVSASQTVPSVITATVVGPYSANAQICTDVNRVYSVCAPSALTGWGFPGDADEFATFLQNANQISVGDFPAVLGTPANYAPAGVAT